MHDDMRDDEMWQRVANTDTSKIQKKSASCYYCDRDIAQYRVKSCDVHDHYIQVTVCVDPTECAAYRQQRQDAARARAEKIKTLRRQIHDSGDCYDYAPQGAKSVQITGAWSVYRPGDGWIYSWYDGYDGDHYTVRVRVPDTDEMWDELMALR